MTDIELKKFMNENFHFFTLGVKTSSLPMVERIVLINELKKLIGRD